MPLNNSLISCSNSVRIPLHSTNNTGTSQFGVSFGQTGQGGRGGKEEGVGAVGVGEAAGGEESSLASPRPGQRGDARRVCLCCVNHYFDLNSVFMTTTIQPHDH